MISYKNRIGILGGIGPEATASFYLKVINKCQTRCHAKYNSDFPHIIINSAPLPDGQMWNGFIKDDVLNFLDKNCKLLENAGSDFIAIPCNSVHHFIKEMRSFVSIPIISIVDETVKKISKDKANRVLLLSTGFTIEKGVYKDAVAKNNIQLILPSKEAQHKVNNITINIESGIRKKSDKDQLLNIIRENITTHRIQGIILGCTELPLLLNQNDAETNIYDTLEILSESAYSLLL